MVSPVHNSEKIFESGNRHDEETIPGTIGRKAGLPISRMAELYTYAPCIAFSVLSRINRGLHEGTWIFRTGTMLTTATM